MQPILGSELILNQRGAIYHLDLTPEELAPLIILVGDPARVRQVSRHFDTCEIIRQNREFITHTGHFHKKRISVISTGIGTDNIDIVLNEIDALVNIDFGTRMVKKDPVHLQIIRIGTAGSLQQDIPVDSFVASTHGLGIDNLLNFYRHQHNDEEQLLVQSFITQTQLHNRFSNPYISSCSPSLIKYFVKDFHQGITVTSPGFYGPQGRILRLGLSNPEFIDHLTRFSFGHHRILNFEMETAAIYGLGRMLGHQCLSLSTIVANRISGEVSKDIAAAVDKLILKTMEIFHLL